MDHDWTQPDALASSVTSVLAVGAVAALAPIPILMILVLLAGTNGRTRAWWFLAGFSGSLLLAGAVTLLLIDRSGTVAQPRWLGVIGIVIGVAFLAMALRLVFQRRGTAGEHAVSALLDGRSSRQLVALGAVAGAGNPKTLPMYLTGVAMIAANGAAGPSRFLELVLLSAMASVGVALPPLLLAALPGEQTRQVLDRVRRTLEPHARRLVILLLAIVGGVYLVVGLVSLR